MEKFSIHNSRVPVLRFTDFDAEYKQSTLKKYAKIFDGTHQTPTYVDKGVPFYSVEQVTANQFSSTKFISESVYSAEFKRVKIERGDILMTRIGDIGTARHIDWDVRASFYVSLSLIKTLGGLNSLYLTQYIGSSMFQKELWKRTIHVAFPKKINLGEIGECRISFPEPEEQERVANFLSDASKLIENLKEQKTKLEVYKRGMMQKIFSQEVRFKDEDGKSFPAWEKTTLDEIFGKKNERNSDNKCKDVLTNSAVRGIVNQRDYFEKDIANQDNLLNYYVVDLDDFVYNPRISNFAPVGPLKRNKSSRGIMSPLYTILTLKKGNLGFYEYYFNTNLWHRYMYMISNFGARHDRMNIRDADLMKMPLPFPIEAEQEKIFVFLNSIDELINAKAEQVAKAEIWKKGLLQKMFI